MSQTADLRVEAWAPTRDGCIRSAVLGTLTSFLDTSSGRPNHTLVCRLTAERDDDLVTLLDEVIYRLDKPGEAPVDVELNGTDVDVDVTFVMADAGTVHQVGAVPKAPSLNDLHFSHGQEGWRCSVTLDV